MVRARLFSLAAVLAGCLASACGGGAGKPVDCTVAAPTGTPIPLPPPDVSLCDLQGWCWEHPLPFRESLGPIWHRPDQTILTTERGGVLRLRDGVWEALEPLPEPDTLDREGQQSLADIWADGDMIYLVGSVSIRGVMWVHDGSGWTAHTFEDDFKPGSVWGVRPGEVMAVGLGGARIYANGEWTITDPPRSIGQSVWGCGDTWFAGLFQGNFLDEEEVIGVYKGGWSKTGDLPAVNVQITGMSGTAADNVFASGTVNGLSEEVAWHWDGSSWTDIDYGDSPGVYDIVALGPDEAVATGVDAGGGGSVKHFAGGAWTPIHDGAFQELSVATSEDIIGRGNLGLQRFDGTDWAAPFPLPLDSDLNSKSFTELWGDGAGTMFMVASDGTVLEGDGRTWTALATPDVAARTINGIWGTSKSHVFIAGDRGLVWHYDGTTVTEMTLPSIDASADYHAFWSPDGTNIYMSGSFGKVMRFDGTDWTREHSGGQDLIAIWGTSATDIWAIGNDGRIYHYDGTLWDDNTDLPGDRPQPVSLWGLAPSDIFVVGDASIWRYDGTDWTETILETGKSLHAVWGRSATDVWAVGQGGSAWHFDGTAWSDVHAEHPWAFNALWAEGTDLWAVGDLAQISRRDLP